MIKKQSLAVLAAAAVLVAGAGVAVAATLTNEARAIEAPVVTEPVSDWRQTGWKSTRELSRCPADEVLVGIRITPPEGLAQGQNHVRCATLQADGYPDIVLHPVGTTKKSGWIDEGEPDLETFHCSGDPLVAVTHLGTYTEGETQYRCAELVVESASVGERVAIGSEDPVWSDWIDSARWSDNKLETAFEYVCPAGSALTGREHSHAGNGKVRFQCTTWGVRS